MEGRVEGVWYWAPYSSSPCYGRGAGAKYAHVNGWHVAIMQSDARHVQPLVARFTLHHGPVIVRFGTDAARGPIGLATAIRGRRVEASRTRRDHLKMTCVVEQAGLGGGKFGNSLCPTLVVRFERILHGCVWNYEQVPAPSKDCNHVPSRF